jgi:hypothetical protein
MIDCVATCACLFTCLTIWYCTDSQSLIYKQVLAFSYIHEQCNRSRCMHWTWHRPFHTFEDPISPLFAYVQVYECGLLFEVQPEVTPAPDLTSSKKGKSRTQSVSADAEQPPVAYWVRSTPTHPSFRGVLTIYHILQAVGRLRACRPVPHTKQTASSLDVTAQPVAPPAPAHTEVYLCVKDGTSTSVIEATFKLLFGE